MTARSTFTKKSIQAAARLLLPRIERVAGHAMSVCEGSKRTRRTEEGQEDVLEVKFVPKTRELWLGAELMIVTTTPPKGIPRYTGVFDMGGIVKRRSTASSDNPAEIQRWLDNLLLS